MNLQSNQTLSEQERTAWINGDIEKAALLAALIDALEEREEVYKRLLVRQ